MTKQEAQRAGKALLKRMKGKGWRLDVWENLGWHYAVRSQYLTVHVSVSGGKKQKYFCLLGDGRSGALGFWTPTMAFRDADPNKVVRQQLEYAQTLLDDHQMILDRARQEASPT